MNFKNEPNPTIFTDYMPNGSVANLIKTKPKFPLSKRYIILLGISIGMKCLYSHKIIHRDLKPDNVLLDKNYHPHICDFGISKIADESVSKIVMESFLGTPLYMAPEILSGENYSYKADVFSFSILAYELITNKVPYTGIKSIHLFFNDVINGKRPDLSIVKEPKVRNFLNKCWSNDPELRPNFDQIVEEIKGYFFMNFMNADKKEVNDYLYFFREKLPPLKKNIQKADPKLPAESKAVQNKK